MKAIKEYFNKLRNDDKHHLGLGDIRLTIGQQEEIIRLIEEEFKKVDLPQVSGALLAEIERLINKYKEERLPNRNMAFHYEAEIDSGFNHFMAWLISNDR